MKARLIRTAMCGGGTSYDILIPTEEISHYKPELHTTNIWDGKPYWKYEYATLPNEHYKMELGWERYENWLNHEKKANIEKLEIIKKYFPETINLVKFPELWVSTINEPSKEIEIII
jgi:hypothetical protein